MLFLQKSPILWMRDFDVFWIMILVSSNHFFNVCLINKCQSSIYSLVSYHNFFRLKFCRTLPICVLRCPRALLAWMAFSSTLIGFKILVYFFFFFCFFLSFLLTLFLIAMAKLGKDLGPLTDIFEGKGAPGQMWPISSNVFRQSRQLVMLLYKF